MLTQEEYKKIKEQAALLDSLLETMVKDIETNLKEWEHLIDTARHSSFERERYMKNKLSSLESAHQLLQSHRRMCKSLPEDIDMAIKLQDEPF